MRLISEKGWYVQPVKKYRKQNPRKDGLLPQQHIDVERDIDSCHEMYFESLGFNKEKKYDIRINDKNVFIQDNSKFKEQKYYKITNINQRLFIEEITFLEFLDAPIKPFDLQISTNEINEKDINFYINILYPQKYEHYDCYLPDKQNIDDVWWIDEYDILGDEVSENVDNEDLGYELSDLDIYDQVVIYHFPEYDIPCGTIWRKV